VGSTPSPAPMVAAGSMAEKQVPEFAVSHEVDSLFEADYDLHRVLGRGANGGVRSAVCRATGRHVAVKSFRKHRMTPEDHGDMRKELELLTSISHPGVVSFEAVYESEGAVHMVMERLSGGELFHRIQKVGRFQEGEAIDVAVQVLETVSYLHSRNILHRDIKPENLVFVNSRSSRLKLIDFGLAATIGRGLRVMGKVGSLGYAAPEVLAGHSYDERADLFSVGCVVYAMLTGRPAFLGGGAEIRRRCELGLVDFGEPCRHLSSEARSFLQALLRPEPTARPSAQEALAHPWLSSCREVVRARQVVKPCAMVKSSSPKSQRPLLWAPCCLIGVFHSVVSMLDRLEGNTASEAQCEVGSF